VEEESEAQDVAQTLNSRPAGALAMARVQEELEREKERRSRAEARAERAEEASREAKATHAELRYSNRKLQERLNARSERSREALSSLRAGLERAEDAAKKRAREGLERANASLSCLARAQNDPDAAGSHLAALNRQLNQLVALLDPTGSNAASADNTSSASKRRVAAAEDELERRASEAEGRAKAAEREVKTLREKLRRSQDADQAIERLKARLNAAERRAAEEARARESLEHAASSTYSEHLREALSLISSRHSEETAQAHTNSAKGWPIDTGHRAQDGYEYRGGADSAATPASSEAMDRSSDNALREHPQSSRFGDDISCNQRRRQGPAPPEYHRKHQAQYEGALDSGANSDNGLPGVQRLREEMDALDAELAEQCNGECTADSLSGRDRQRHELDELDDASEAFA
jgi:hypothetical protein